VLTSILFNKLPDPLYVRFQDVGPSIIWKPLPLDAKKVKGYQTGDIVKAVVTSGKKIGIHVGRVAVRATGSFDITTLTGTIEGISHRFCRPLHRVDGYSYQYGRRVTFPLSCLKA